MHATRHVMCPLVLVTWKVMGAKHEKVGGKKNLKGNGQREGKKMHHCSCTDCINNYGHVYLGEECTTLQFSSFTLVYENLYL